MTDLECNCYGLGSNKDAGKSGLTHLGWPQSSPHTLGPSALTPAVLHMTVKDRALRGDAQRAGTVEQRRA